MKTNLKTRMTDRDELLFKFISRHKYIDSVGGGILFGTSEIAFMKRVRLLAKDGYLIIKHIAIKRYMVTLIGAGKILKGIETIDYKIKDPVDYLPDTQYVHDINITRIAAAFTGLGWKYLTAKEFKKQNLKSELIPDLYVGSHKTGYEVEMHKKQKIRYKEKLIALQNSKDMFSRLIYLTPFQGYITSVVETSDEYRKDRFSVEMIFSDTRKKIEEFEIDEFIGRFITQKGNKK